MNNFELPLVFGMALAHNERAMAKFESLSETERKAVIEKTHNIKSKSEMRSFVSSLADSTGV